MGLPMQFDAFNIASLTKNNYTQCHASNLAFFVPKIVPNGMEDRNRISKYGRVKERIKDLFEGNKFNRVVAISNTRPPETKTGGLAKNNYGGQTMPINSQAPMIGQFSFSINLPEDSFISRFIAVASVNTWAVLIETCRGQQSPIQEPHTGKVKQFDSLDELAFWLASKGVPEMSVLLPTMGGAE
jgi:hypothetical protein